MRPSKKKLDELKSIISQHIFDKLSDNPIYDSPPENWSNEEKEKWDLLSDIERKIHQTIDNIF